MSHISIYSPSRTADVQDAAKRFFDIGASAILIILLAPLFALAALAIRLEAPGPVIFRQQRIGRYGKPFTLFKLRTMVHCADDAIHRQAIERLWAGQKLSEDPDAPFKMAKDPRITRIGQLLRRTSIDELPQLLNVLRGDMSLVGPRPMIAYEVANFQDWHHERHQVRPGITGMSQVFGRGRATMEDLLRLDVEYVRSRSFLTDIKLMLLTIPKVLSGVGAR